MTGTRKTNAWAGRTVRICPTATVAYGQPHPHAGAHGLVLDVPPTGDCYSVRLRDGSVINAGVSVLLPDGPAATMHLWPVPHAGTRPAGGHPAGQQPLNHATSRAPLRLQGPLLRAGAADAARVPSRVGARLHHACGRVTDLQGNPLTRE
ncbi:hypothetical protein [Melaminivora sp.]|uniref:hypothetical protein n=1 Tax=Melaminivora sp. TaxID=1933032 RepID=UPI0028A7DE93|nr:hypothetical protein [Melaminivora sp.]